MFDIPTTYDAKNRIWSGAKRSSIYGEDVSVGRLIFNAMKNWPKNVFQIYDTEDVKVTNGEGLAWAIRLAQHFKKRGLNHTDVIGIAAKNTTYVMPLGVACLMNTTPFHSINPMLDEDTLRHIFKITKPTLIFCDGQEYAKVYAATTSPTWKPEIYTLTDPIIGVPTIESLLTPTTTEMFYSPEPLKSGAEQTMAILCSSGTTGLPKAVCMSNSTLIPENVPITSETVIFVQSGLDWITGLWAFVASTLIGCTRIITSQPFNPEYFIKLVNKYKISYAVLPPRYLAALTTCPDATPEALAPIRMMSYGGGMASVATMERARELCKGAIFTCAYAMTEVGGITVNIGLSNASSAGKPSAGIKIRIVDENGKSLPHNEVGEIYVHTSQTWNGYYGNPLESRRMQDYEGWFHTGDLGYFDDRNYLYIVDRKKEILKYQGLHYWPTEIENVIAELQQVQDVCVVGVYDERHGDAAGALVVKRQGSTISARDIEEHVAKRLTGIQKQLNAGVRFTDKLPTNVNGKVVRKAAREVFVAQNGAAV
ncbi:4-coumarate--CoA ligase 1-like [Scaptodrosophila lebanonensis]|uniref:4-coumarate--CoA ligase 1-like n=1 Tax=Drosophila lebanonensis TaxID=7225 RepID=A0A6J2UK72_DROLE|nr:4-coumarate--CoA ligase 1-like [Scaptodrosophila lebanonensis]